MISNEVIYGILLGIIQGLTEFLPISSSGHLIIFSSLYNGDALPLSLNIALHLGTVAAVLIYFWRDWVALVVATERRIIRKQKSFESDVLLKGIILGSIPAGVVGILWKDEIEAYLHSPIVTVAPLAIVGILMWWFDKSKPATKDLNQMTVTDAIWIGFAQALALIPGTSRSGITIMAGRIREIKRADAARFSFLLGTPAMAGAAVLEAREIANHIGDPLFAIGFVSAFVSGIIAIKILLGILRKYGFAGFAIYRLALAAIILIVV